MGALFDTSFPYAAWRYDFLQLEQVRISGSAGINYLTIEAGLKAEGNVTDPNGVAVSGEVDESFDLAVPVPQVGHRRGLEPSPLSGKMCGPSDSLRASRTPPVRRSAISPT